MKAFRKRGFVTFEAVEAPRSLENFPNARRKSQDTQKTGLQNQFWAQPAKKNWKERKKKKKNRITACMIAAQVQPASRALGTIGNN